MLTYFFRKGDIYSSPKAHWWTMDALGYTTANAPAAAKHRVCGCSTPGKGRCWTGVERVEHGEGEGREGVQHLAQKWCCTCSTPPPEVVLNMVCTTPAQRWTGGADGLSSWAYTADFGVLVEKSSLKKNLGSFCFHKNTSFYMTCEMYVYHLYYCHIINIGISNIRPPFFNG